MKNYIVKTRIGTEQRVIDVLTARLSDAGSIKDKAKMIGKMYNPEQLNGYIFVQAEEEHYLEAVLGLLLSESYTRIKNISKIVGEVSQEVFETHLMPKIYSENLEIGEIVLITKGVWKNEMAIITGINPNTDEISLELFGDSFTIPIPINNIPAKFVRR